VFIIPQSYMCSLKLSFQILHNFIESDGSLLHSSSNQLTHEDKKPVLLFGGKWEPFSSFTPAAEKQMINTEVVMAERGRDAMGLLSLMIGLSDCCNGLECLGQWFTRLLSVWQGGSSKGLTRNSSFFFAKAPVVYRFTHNKYACTLLLFCPAKLSVVLHS